MLLNGKEITHVHFIGVNGIGVSALLRLFASKGVSVSGSDVALPPLRVLPSGNYHEGHRAENVPDATDLIIYSPAVPETNPELVEGNARGITIRSYPEMLGDVTRDYNTIAISGTHGKSTTTALMGKLFHAGDLDPSVIVGAEVPGFDHNLLQGKSDIFIVEACEYRRNMMQLAPQAILLTNLELDHPDYYEDLADIKNAFRDYIEKLRGEGLLIVNNDDANIRDVIRSFDGILVRFGVGAGADLALSNARQSGAHQYFDLSWKGTALGTFTTPLPGLYNLYNILGAVAGYLTYGGNPDAIHAVLESFTGIGRRFQEVGTIGNTAIISDYAHHPTALRAVVDAALSRFKGKRLLTIFRPHHRERSLKLFDQFVATLVAIPHTLLLEIYDVAGREDGIVISSRDMVTAVLAKDPRADIVYAADLAEAESFARAHVADFDVILVVGAGDADELAQQLVTNNP